MNDITALMATMKEAAEKATPGIWEMEQENIWFFQDGYTKHLMYVTQGDDVDDRQDHINTQYIAEASPTNVLALVEALEKREELRASANRVVNQQDIELQELRQRNAELVEALERAHLEISSANRMMKAQDQELITRRQRIASLESRTVKLPPRVDSSNVPFTAHTWNCCLDAVEKCLDAAGIQVIEGGE
jgi:hypothetical protein